MRSVVAAALIALAIIHGARADDAPTDRDLQVAYCVGSGRACLQAQEAVQTKGDPVAEQLKQKFETDLKARDRHYLLYLMSRGYFDSPGPRTGMVEPAMVQGEEDTREDISTAYSCASQCAPSDQSKVRMEAASRCFKTCKATHMSEAKASRIATCESLEKELPF